MNRCWRHLEENLREDLRLTLAELSDTYEELCLLYRISSAFSGKTVGEICENMLDEVTSVCGVETAAVLFPEGAGKGFFTRSSRGAWEPSLCFAHGEGPFGDVMGSRKSAAFCKSGDSDIKGLIPGAASVLICPLSGKSKNIGLLVIADPTQREYYSGDLKLINAITEQAAIFIERTK